MMTMDKDLNERDKGEEARFKLSEEQTFKIRARRNKLVGLWAAARLGLTPAAHETYAKELVLASMDSPGDDRVISKLLNDLNTADSTMDEDAIRRALRDAEAEAIRQITGVYPHALDTDHEQVGG